MSSSPFIWIKTKGKITEVDNSYCVECGKPLQ